MPLSRFLRSWLSRTRFLACHAGTGIHIMPDDICVGFLVSSLLAVDEAQEASLMYGLGMNNNGTGLVLAAMSLAAYPR